jgi:hypothetical protein
MDMTIWRAHSACGFSKEPQHLLCAVEHIDTADAGQNNSAFYMFHQDHWYAYALSPDWSAVALAAVDDPSESLWLVVGVSPVGDLWEMHPKLVQETYSRIPEHQGITNLAGIEGAIYACGMGRIAVRRDARDLWTDISAPWPDIDEGVIGFTAIAGLAASLIYAVGWQGEIWTRSNERWEREVTPGNANLNAVAIAPDGTVYSVGDRGAMFKGRKGAWDVVDTGIGLNLTDVCVYEGHVFACTDFAVYRLTSDGLVNDIPDDATDRPSTCLKLVSTLTALYSVGPSDVFVRSGGVWSRMA